MKQHRELKYTELKARCSSESLNFATTDELTGLKDGIIGQERAAEAFDFGLMVKMKGYNIYMAGQSGTGKTTYARAKTEEIAITESVPDDWCYVYNFNDPRAPIALRFEPGMGRQFRDDMNELVEIFNTEILKVFNSSDYDKQKNEILKRFDGKRDEMMKDMSEMAKGFGFGVKSTNSGIYFMPMLKGEMLDEEEYEKLDEETKEEIGKHSSEVQEKAASIMRDIRELDRSCRREVEDLEYKVGMFAIGHHINAILEKYKDHERALEYIKAVQEDVLDNINEFMDEDEDVDEALASLIPMLAKKQTEDITLKYSVNLIVDNSEAKGAPVVVDFNPTYYNLLGEVEYDNEYGNLTTDFMKIKGGLFHKANGGYLILQAQDVLTTPQSWEALRRVIKTREISIENLRDQLGIMTTPTLKPEPIPVSVKVIMTGSGYYYEILNEYDEDFGKFFKIKADFDYEMKRSSENILKLAQFMKSFSDREKTPPFDASAVARVTEYSSRLVESQKKLSTRFNHISDILCEAATRAKLDGAEVITAAHIDRAVSDKERRLRLYEEKIDELHDDGVIMLDVDGEKTAQINGLAVFDMGNYAFGAPTRITATTYLGKSGIVNIEKEAEMSGQTHNKGVQIISGYIGQTYAQDFPLSLSCRICFEQNYNGIDGDSASSTEAYCIISSLSGLPIKQSLAVTGSVNQRGEIQAIGGVTYKIEGFFKLCKKRGLTGSQGVIIPQSNIDDLTLNDEVVEAVKNGLFHIYPISVLDEGIELLMGREAGGRGANGKFPPDSVHGMVMKKLKEYYKKSIGEGVKLKSGKK